MTDRAEFTNREFIPGISDPPCNYAVCCEAIVTPWGGGGGGVYMKGHPPTSPLNPAPVIWCDITLQTASLEGENTAK